MGKYDRYDGRRRSGVRSGCINEQGIGYDGIDENEASCEVGESDGLERVGDD